MANQATTAPMTTISPWAKLIRPVVPKISDRPTAVMAMMSPNRMPGQGLLQEERDLAADRAALTERDRDGTPARPDADLDGVAVGVAQLDALRERVDGDGVVAGTGDLELPLAVLVGDGLAELRAARLGDGQLDALDRTVRVAEGPEQHRRLGLVAARLGVGSSPSSSWARIRASLRAGSTGAAAAGASAAAAGASKASDNAARTAMLSANARTRALTALLPESATRGA